MPGGFVRSWKSVLKYPPLSHKGVFGQTSLTSEKRRPLVPSRLLNLSSFSSPLKTTILACYSNPIYQSDSHSEIHLINLLSGRSSSYPHNTSPLFSFHPKDPKAWRQRTRLILTWSTIATGTDNTNLRLIDHGLTVFLAFLTMNPSNIRATTGTLCISSSFQKIHVLMA